MILTVDTTTGAHLGISLTDSDRCAGVEVTEVLRNDVCGRAGLTVESIIVKVNGSSVSGHQDAMAKMSAGSLVRYSCASGSDRPEVRGGWDV